MKNTIAAWKVVALVTSLGLFGAYVAFRAFAARSAEPAPPAEAPTAAPAADPEAFLGGSKSMIVFPPPAEGMDGREDEYRMRGSKSGPVFETKDVDPPEKKKHAP